MVLIAGFEALDRRLFRQALPRWLMPVFTLVLTSVLAGLATAPFAAATFNRFTDYGLLANLLTVPVMSVLMAAGAVAVLLAPFGLAAPAFWVMDMAARWILAVAHWVAGLEGAVTPIPAPGPAVIPLITLAGAWAILWRGRGRLAALPVLALALTLWAMTLRPALLISADGALVGLIGPEGRALSAPRGARFAAETWLQDDGDLAGPADAAARPGFWGPKTARGFQLDAWRGVVLTGSGAPAAVAAACAGHDLVVLPARHDPPPASPPGCLLIDRKLLRQTGALALSVEDGALILDPARGAARLWMADTPVLARRRLPRGETLIAGQ